MADLSPELAAQLQSLESSYAENPGRYFVPFAGLLREAGQPERAEELLRENLKRFPGLSPHVLLGRCLADRGAYEEASNEFHYVLSIDSQNLIALRTLAEMAAARGRVDEARRWYAELQAVDPMNADARAALARLAGSDADAATADQPAGTLDGWPGAAEPAAAAGAGALADADDDGGDDLEWGNLDLGGSEPSAPADAPPAPEFDAFGFGEVELGGAVEPLPDDEPRQDPGAALSGDLPLLDFGGETEAEEEAFAVAEPEAEGGEPEVVTETMAELYASQGLAGRAAEVYRELIQRRGEEPGLVARLAELEGAERGAPAAEEAPEWLLRVDEAAAAPTGFEERVVPEEEEEKEVGATAWSEEIPEEEPSFEVSVSAGFGGAGAALEPEPAAGYTEGFDLVVIDESAELDGDLHPPASAEEAAELSADWAVAAAPLEEQEDEVEAAAHAPAGRTMRAYFATLLAWSPEGSAATAEEAEPAVAAEAAPPTSVEPDAAAEPEEPLPWELPAEPEAPAEEPPHAEPAPAAADAGAGFSFEEFFTPEPEPEPAAPPAAAPPPESAGTEAAGAAAAGEEDEDLESFQAWLQSLKR